MESDDKGRDRPAHKRSNTRKISVKTLEAKKTHKNALFTSMNCHSHQVALLTT